MRKARLLACSCRVEDEFSGRERLEKNHRLILACLDRAREFRPDFVAFSEIALHVGVAPTREALKYAETVPGPMTAAAGEKAKALAAYVLLTMYEKRDDRLYNSVVLIDREGEVKGVYRKSYATPYEMEDGVQPGDDVPVWRTDAGRVGCAVCFDLKFPEVALALSRQKARVVFWPSMFAGGRRLASWAMDYGFYVVKCTDCEGEIVDPCGNTLARSGTPAKLDEAQAAVAWTFAEVNTDRKTYHLDFNQEKLPKILARYGSGAEICINEPEATFSLASSLPDRTVEDLEREFGLEDLRDYLDRAARTRRERLGRASRAGDGT